MSQPQRKLKEPSDASHLEALTSINKRNVNEFTTTIAESANSIAKRQAEIMRSGVQCAVQLVQYMCVCFFNPQRHMEPSMEFGRIAAENTFAMADEMSKVPEKAGTEMLSAMTEGSIYAFMAKTPFIPFTKDSRRSETIWEAA